MIYKYISQKESEDYIMKKVLIGLLAITLVIITFASCGTPVKKISLDGATIKVNQSIKLTYKISPKEAKDAKLSWKSSDEKIATVDENGKVKGISIGECKITATADSGVKDETDITVKSEYTPSKKSVANGIKARFKDPDSVEVTDGWYAPVLDGVEESDRSFYIIATVRAKNGFGGYGDPTEYIIRCDGTIYSIESERNSFDPLVSQAEFDELGCGSMYFLE